MSLSYFIFSQALFLSSPPLLECVKKNDKAQYVESKLLDCG
jgi:hypothetical protein